MNSNEEKAKGKELTAHEQRHPDQWLRVARRLLTLALDHGETRMDKVRRGIVLPSRVGTRFLGSVSNRLARLGLIERLRYEPTDQPGSHRRPVSVWAVTSAEDARRWLRANPAPGRFCQGCGEITHECTCFAAADPQCTLF